MDEIKGEVGRREEIVPMAGRVEYMSGWARAVSIVVGIISIILALVVILYPAITVATLALIFSIALFILGIDRLATGISGRRWSTI